VCLLPKICTRFLGFGFSRGKLSMKRVINARITTRGTTHMKAALARYTALPLIIAGVTPNTLPKAADPIANGARK